MILFFQRKTVYWFTLPRARHFGMRHYASAYCMQYTLRAQFNLFPVSIMPSRHCLTLTLLKFLYWRPDYNGISTNNSVHNWLIKNYLFSSLVERPRLWIYSILLWINFFTKKAYIFFLTRVRIGIRICCQVYLTVLHIKTTNKIKILAVWRRIRFCSNLFASLSRINLRPLSLYQCFATLYIICLCVKEGRYKDRTLTNMTFIKLARYQIAFENH